MMPILQLNEDFLSIPKYSPIFRICLKPEFHPNISKHCKMSLVSSACGHHAAPKILWDIDIEGLWTAAKGFQGTSTRRRSARMTQPDAQSNRPKSGQVVFYKTTIFSSKVPGSEQNLTISPMIVGSTSLS